MKIRSNYNNTTFLAIRCFKNNEAFIIYNKSISEFLDLLDSQLLEYDNFSVITINGWVDFGSHKDTTSILHKLIKHNKYDNCVVKDNNNVNKTNISSKL